ncbi:MAG: hypothetical protein JXR22_00465 [Prolixibacteraceae bacterium]|nr:hypothetical protein [Prolixibacteraceae bacterium]
MKSLFQNLVIKIVAAFLIFAGFGMIHASTQVIERLGSIFIGIGALYFILLLVFYKPLEQKENQPK